MVWLNESRALAGRYSVSKQNSPAKPPRQTYLLQEYYVHEALRLLFIRRITFSFDTRLFSIYTKICNIFTKLKKKYNEFVQVLLYWLQKNYFISKFTNKTQNMRYFLSCNFLRWKIIFIYFSAKKLIVNVKTLFLTKFSSWKLFIRLIIK